MNCKYCNKFFLNNIDGKSALLFHELLHEDEK